MAIYCVGDLHGQHDLFIQLLEKISFNPSIDKLYLLGDVIDRSYGGIKILNFAIQHPSSCFLIKGNHESIFEWKIADYDLIMENPIFKHALGSVIDVFSENLFGQIETSFRNRIPNKEKNTFYTAPKIKKWLKTGDSKRRTKLLDAMVSLVEQIEYDPIVFDTIYRVLGLFSSSYQTKEFVRELLEQTTEHYHELKTFIYGLPNKYSFEYCETQFCLIHSISQANSATSYKLMFPHANTENTTYVYGHTPVPKIHGRITKYHSDFNFDCRQIFSWVDERNNRYYNLDLGSNPIAAIKLDDMSEYYMGTPRGNPTTWTIPKDIILEGDTSYCHVMEQRCNSANLKKETMLTFKDGCYEFIITLAKRRKEIHYTHVSWLDYIHKFVISDWNDAATKEEIIQQVKADFEQIKESEEGQRILAFLRG